MPPCPASPRVLFSVKPAKFHSQYPMFPSILRCAPPAVPNVLRAVRGGVKERDIGGDQCHTKRSVEGIPRYRTKLVWVREDANGNWDRERESQRRWRQTEIRDEGGPTCGVTAGVKITLRITAATNRAGLERARELYQLKRSVGEHAELQVLPCFPTSTQSVIRQIEGCPRGNSRYRRFHGIGPRGSVRPCGDACDTRRVRDCCRLGQRCTCAASRCR